MKILLFFFLFFSFRVFSHPVIYKGGWVLSSMNMSELSNNYVMYSFTQKLSFGLEHWRFSHSNHQPTHHNEFGFLKLNYLLYRSNNEDSQLNLYFHGGAGSVDLEFPEDKNSLGLLSGLEGDWETRDLYVSGKYLQFNDTFLSQMRFGLSPRKASFEELQTWFMLQGMVFGDIKDSVMITPMLRFFYHNVLWEMGSSTRGEWMLNLMTHL